MDTTFLSQTRLFSGVDPEALPDLLRQVHAYSRDFAKGETVLHAGDPVTHMGLVLHGSVLMPTMICGGTGAFWAERHRGKSLPKPMPASPGNHSPCM